VWDLIIRDAIHQLASPVLTKLMIAMSIVGASYITWPLTVVCVVLFYRAGNIRALGQLALSMPGALALEFTVKQIVRRPRPEPFFGYPLPHSYSFPSGHALFAVACFGMLATLVAPLIPTRIGRALLWTATILLVAAIGFSRVYLGVHYPSDVLGGYAIGLVWVWLAKKLWQRQ